MMYYFQRNKKILDQLLSRVLWSFFLEKYFEAICAKELHFKQGECELEDLTYRLSLINPKML